MPNERVAALLVLAGCLAAGCGGRPAEPARATALIDGRASGPAAAIPHGDHAAHPGGAAPGHDLNPDHPAR